MVFAFQISYKLILETFGLSKWRVLEIKSLYKLFQKGALWKEVFLNCFLNLKSNTFINILRFALRVGFIWKVLGSSVEIKTFKTRQSQVSILGSNDYKPFQKYGETELLSFVDEFTTPFERWLVSKSLLQSFWKLI